MGFHESENGITAMTVTLLEGNDIIEPNKPYLIRAKTVGEKRLILPTTTLSPAQVNSIEFSASDVLYTLTGSYQTLDGDSLIKSGYYTLNDGEIRQTEDPMSTLSSYRWFLSIKDHEENVINMDDVKILVFNKLGERMNFWLTYSIDGEQFKTYLLYTAEHITPEAEPTKEGYTFSGWIGEPATMPAHDVNVTGTFSINKYKVTYIVDGDIYKEMEVTYGAEVPREGALEKEGYSFSGWSEVPEIMPAYDLIITGTFTINQYTIKFIVDGEVISSETQYYQTQVTPPIVPEREGYTFTWDNLPVTIPAHDVTVTGTFKVNQYTIIYVINDETYTSVIVDYGSTITPPEVPEKAGSTFSWIDVPETMPAHDITIEGAYTDGISLTPDPSPVGEGRIYNLSGQRLSQPQRGVNIINGKKVVVK